MSKYTLVCLDAQQSYQTDSEDVAVCWAMFVQLIGFKEFYIVEQL